MTAFIILAFIAVVVFAYDAKALRWGRRIRKVVRRRQARAIERKAAGVAVIAFEMPYQRQLLLWRNQIIDIALGIVAALVSLIIVMIFIGIY